ncbi:hypothetical protein ACWEQL_36190 [Kitasatospora sp. NPDC004240]
MAVAAGAKAPAGGDADGAAVGESGAAVPGNASPTFTEASPPENTSPSGWAFGATLPSGVSTNVVSTGTHASPAFIRIGPPDTSWVSVPSGFAHNVTVGVRAPVTSTRCPCRRADSNADARSGASLVLGAGEGAATADTGASASSATPACTSSPNVRRPDIRRTLREEKAPPAYAEEA